MRRMIALFAALAALPVVTVAASDRTAAEPRDCAAVASRQLAGMPVDERVGQLVMVGGSAAEDSRLAVERLNVGMVALPEMPSPRAAAAYTASLQAVAKRVPVLVGGDFEYGAAHQIDGTTAYPRGMGLGAARDPAKAAAAAAGTATELRRAGVRLNFAPVADVNSNPVVPFGVRSFGEDPALVSRLTAAQVDAYRRGGVAATVKHFPGLGGVTADPHHELPTVDIDRETMERVHFPPFRAAIAARTPVIMTGHIVLKAVDPDLPATLSSKMISGLLRGELGYDGVVITDAMQMGAIADTWGIGGASVLAVQAGVDVVLSTGPYRDHEAVVNALRAGLSQERIDESALRVLKLKCEFGGPAAQAPGTNAERIAIDSITLLDNRSRALPFTRDASTLVVGVRDVEPLARAMGANWWQAASEDPTDAEIAGVVAQAPDQVLVATYSRAATLPAGQVKLVQALKATGKRVAAVSIGVPYDVNAYPDLGAALASYAQTQVWGEPPPPNETVLSAVAKVVYGTQPGGRLPVTVSTRYPYGHGLRY